MHSLLQLRYTIDDLYTQPKSTYPPVDIYFTKLISLVYLPVKVQAQRPSQVPPDWGMCDPTFKIVQLDVICLRNIASVSFSLPSNAQGDVFNPGR